MAINDSDLPSVNRCLILVRPTEIFLKWALEVPSVHIFIKEELQLGQPVYLVPEYEYDEDKEKVLKKHYKKIFSSSLSSWCLESDYWPKKRGYREFKKWFDVEFHEIVLDIELDEELKHEDY